MRLLLLLLFFASALGAAAQPRIEPLGKPNGRVQVQNEFEVLGDFYPAYKDTTGAAPSRLGAVRFRPTDKYPYVYVSATGRRWFPLIPTSKFDTVRFASGLYLLNGVIGARLASAADTGVVTPVDYQSILDNTAKRVVDLTITGTGATKTATLVYNDATQIVRTFNDNSSGGVSSVGASDLLNLYTASVSANPNPVITYTPVQQAPYSVFGTQGTTSAFGSIQLSTDYILSGIFSPARLPQASASSAGILTIADYNRLFIRQSLSNPTGTVTVDITAGGQTAIALTSTGSRTLVLSNLRAGDREKVVFNNTSGSAITLTLPAASYVAGTGAATTITIPTGRSILQLEDFDGTSSWFSLRTF